MRIAAVRLVTFRGRSAGIVAFLGLTITVVALVIVVAFRRRSVDVIVSRRRSIAGRRGIGVRGGGHIIAICGRVVRIGYRIPVSPVITPPVANVLTVPALMFVLPIPDINGGVLRSRALYLSRQHPQSLRHLTLGSASTSPH